MKRFVCLLLVLYLPLTALAESAPAHVAEQLYSNTGYTSITIDADVIVPEAQNIPRYQVKLREFTETEVMAMAHALFSNRSYTGDDAYQDANDYNSGRRFSRSMRLKTTEYIDTRRGAELPLYSLYAYTGYDMDGVTPNYVYASLEQAQVLGEGNFYGTMPNEIEAIPEQGLVGCNLSLEAARTQVDAAVQAFAPWLTRSAEGVMWADTIPGDNEDVYGKHHQGWAFVYTRDLPLPLNYEITSPSNSYGLRIPDEFLRIVVDDEGIQGMRYEMPLEIVQTLEVNCALLSFDQIMDVSRTIFPLRYAYYEGSYKDIRININRMTLGYMVVLSRNSSDYCEVIPVWDFFGTAEMRQETAGEVVVTWDNPYESLLTINAIDGTVIDRTYGY